MEESIPSPAISIVGRHNSGKTTCIVKLISELVGRGFDVGSIKHHSHVGFDIDYPGKDSYRHREAGASETIIAAPGQMACIKSLDGEVECDDLVRQMPNHDLVIVEGYRKSMLPTIEIMRGGNESDARVAAVFAEGAQKGWPLGTDFTQMTRGIVHAEEEEKKTPEAPGASSQAVIPHIVQKKFTVHAPDNNDISNKLPTSETVAIVTDIPEAAEAAETYGIACFSLEDTKGLADFVEKRFVRPKLSVVIQAGGESRRMGRSKATVPFAGQPLIAHLVERLGPIADELIITTNEAENLTFLHEQFPSLSIRLEKDLTDRRGALPGLYTALSKASHPFVGVVACDMVFASTALLIEEADLMRRYPVDVVVPRNRHGYEPFHAVYRKETCLPPVTEVMQKGEKKAQALFDRVTVLELSQDEILKIEPAGGCFVNVNTPEELRAVEDSYLG